MQILQFPLHNAQATPRQRASCGFTLVELLAVVAIIAVLAVLALPILSNISGGAKSARCLSNLRQIGIGLLGYSADNSGKFPPNLPKAGDPEFDGDKRWVERTVPYMGQAAATKRSVWICPDTKYKVPETLSGLRNTTYSIHGALTAPEGNPNDPFYSPRPRLSSIPRQSQLILVADGVQESVKKPFPALMIYWPNAVVYVDVKAEDLDKPFAPEEANKYGNLSYHHHGDMCNAVLVDGSARSFKLGDVRLRNICAKDK